jgi:hypothetical protein
VPHSRQTSHPHDFLHAPRRACDAILHHTAAPDSDPMRRLAFACLSACLLAGAARADDKVATPELTSHECGLSTPFNVQVDGGGIWLYRESGTPEEIFFHDGVLSVDHKVRAVSDADAQRLREMERNAQVLMPQVAGIARDSIDLTFDALHIVMREMTDSERKGNKVERYRTRALDQIDGSLGKGRWDQDVFGEAFERNVEEFARKMTGSITRSALWAVATGRADALDERSDRVDAEVDRMVDTRTAAIETKAHALCPQVESLRTLQDALEYRYHGAPLVMLAPKDGSDAAPRDTTTATTAESPRDNSIPIASQDAIH